MDWQLKDFAQFLQDPEELKLFARGGDDLLQMLKMQMEGRLDSWSIRFDYAHYKYDALFRPLEEMLKKVEARDDKKADTKEAWEDLKKGVNRAYDELDAAVKKAADEFK